MALTAAVGRLLYSRRHEVPLDCSRIAGFAVWLVATFAVVYAAVELAEDDAPVVAEAPIATATPIATVTPLAGPTFAQSVCEKLQTDLLDAQTDVAAAAIVLKMRNLNC